jgi:hypothetical protein
MSSVLIQVNYSILKQTYSGPFYANNPIAHYVCARIEPKDDFFFYDLSHGHKIGSLDKLLKHIDGADNRSFHNLFSFAHYLACWLETGDAFGEGERSR